MSEKIRQACSQLTPQARIDLCVAIAEKTCGTEPPSPDVVKPYTLSTPGSSLRLFTDYGGCVNASAAYVRYLPDNALAMRTPGVSPPPHPVVPGPQPPAPAVPVVSVPPADPFDLSGLLLPTPTPSLQKMPEFQLKRVDGSQFRSSSLKGNYAILTFGAIYCEPCKEEWIALQNLVDNNTDVKNLRVLVLAEDSGRFLRQHIAEDKLRIPFVKYGENNDVFERFQKVIPGEKRSTAIPQSFVIDPAGNIIGHFRGFFPKKGLSEIVTLLQQNGLKLKDGAAPPAIAPPVHQPPTPRPGAKMIPAFQLPAFDATARNGEGRLVSHEDVRGKFAVITFGGTWCGPCRMEWTELEKLKQRNPQTANLAIMVITDDPPDNLNFYLKSKPLTLQFLLEEDYRAPTIDKFAHVIGKRLDNVPQSFVIDPAGNIIGHFEGYSSHHLRNIVSILGRHGLVLN